MTRQPRTTPHATTRMTPALRGLWSGLPYGVVVEAGDDDVGASGGAGGGAGVVDVFVGARAPLVDAALMRLAPGCAAWAYLTAHNPGGARVSDDDNARAHAALRSELGARGLPVLAATGGRGPDPSWPPEESVVVGGLDLVDAHALARRYGQAGLLYARRGAPVALVPVHDAAFDAPRALHTVAWIDVDDDGRTLMARPHGKALFFMPGGKKEPGEHDVGALVRELAEELGVVVDEASVTARFVVEEEAHGARTPTVVRMACYAARVAGTPAPSSEIAELARFTRADVDGTDLVPPAGREVLARVQAERGAGLHTPSDERA
jgi:8-oxo-dGTP pyrophosphatase MutT (NUDIX family)